MAQIEKMTVKEFRELGYLQELNRQFLHPLGLALEVTIHEDGSETIKQVWDYRDEPEGMVYGDGMIDQDKALRISAEMIQKSGTRREAFGWDVQPTETIDG